MDKFIKKGLQSIFPFAIILVVWEASAQIVFSLRGVAFPSPWQTVVRLLELLGGDRLSNASIYVHIGSSLQRWLVGFSIAAFLGIAY